MKDLSWTKGTRNLPMTVDYGREPVLHLVRTNERQIRGTTLEMPCIVYTEIEFYVNIRILSIIHNR